MNPPLSRSRRQVGDHQRTLVPVKQEIEIHERCSLLVWAALVDGERKRAAHNDECQDDGNGPVEPVTADCLFGHWAASQRVSSSALPGWSIV